MAIRTAGTITRNPPQQRPQALPERRDRKLGPGTLRTPANVTGPARYQPLVNAQSQSARSNAASFGAPAIPRGEGVKSRTIDRASIELPSAYGYSPSGA